MYLEQDYSLNGSIATVNPYRYRGYYYDKETELYYLQSRYYDAEVGRFVNGDDANVLQMEKSISNKNLFSYCKNEPILNYDLYGYWSVKRDSISFLIDITISLVNFWAKYAYDLIGMGLKAIFKKAGKKFLLDTLSGTVPKIKSWAGKFLTAIRTVLWRIGFVALSCLVDKIKNYITSAIKYIQKKYLKKTWLSKNDLNTIYCFFSTGGIIALFFDYMSDGNINNVIKIF